MNSEEVTIISIVGRQNVGKTTLIRELIPRLKGRGYRVGTLKYNIREFKIDHEGKDTYKYFLSGADTVALSSPDEVAVIKRVKDSLHLDEIMEKYFSDVNVMLVEGCSTEGYPRIKITDPQKMDTVGNNSNNELLLVRENSKTKCFSEKDINKALDFVEDIISHNNKAVIQENT